MASVIILITGANQGVGYATAKVITSASENFHVIIAGRSLEKAEAAATEIKASGVKGSLSAIQLEVTDEKSIEEAAASVEEQFGRLDVLINNAGVANGAPDLKIRYSTCFNTNVVGPVLVSAAFRPLLLKSENPYSIYVSSVVGSNTLAADPNSPYYRGPPNGEAYRASKAALNMVILQELAQLGDIPLKIFAFCPGMVRSNLAGGGEFGRLRNSRAGDPEDSGRGILRTIQGERDADVGKFIHEKGTYPW